MDSTQLPPPTRPTDTSGFPGGPAPTVPTISSDPSVDSSPSSPDPVRDSHPSDQPPVAPDLALASDSPSQSPPVQSLPTQSPPGPSSTAPSTQISSINEPEPVFRSPIIAGLQNMQTEPFQHPQDPMTPVQTEQTTPKENPNIGPIVANSVPTGATGKEPTMPVPPTEPPALTHPAGSGQAGPPPSKRAKIEGSLFGKKWFLGLILVVIVGVMALLGWNWWQSRTNTTPGGNAPTAAKVNLTYWGLWEEKEIMAPLIKKYQDLHPEVTITYEHQNHRQYRSRVQAAIRQGQGPDILRYHNTWLPMLQDDLATAPGDTLTAQEIQNEFYPVVAQNVVKGNQVYGVPLMYDGLALVYNESMLQAANALPPRDWRTLREVAAALTIRNEARLERGGVALGTADNVDHFSDIYGLLMLQNGADLAQPTSETAKTTLEFYTLFHRMDGDWDTTMPQSTLAFANEQVAMIFVPSWRIHEIRQLNPNLQFGVATLPQLSDDKVTWATYWVEGVSKKSRHPQEAWKFLAWLSQPEQLRQLYSEAAKYRGFGELYPRVEMASELSEDPDLVPYLQDALYAQSLPLADRTHDEGLNDQLIAYFKDAINSMNERARSEEVLTSIEPGIKTVLSKFGAVVSR